MKKLFAFVVGILVAITVNAMEKPCSKKNMNLHEAINAEDQNRVSELLTYHNFDFGFDVDVNTKNENGMTPLHCAVEQGHVGIVKVLLEDPKIMIDEKNKDGLTALHIALEYCKQGFTCNMSIQYKVAQKNLNNYLEIAHLLVLKGADITLNIKNFQIGIVPADAPVVKDAVVERNKLIAEKCLKAAKIAVCAGKHVLVGVESNLRFLNQDEIKSIVQYLGYGDYVHKSMVVAPC